MKNRKGKGMRILCWCLFAMYLAALIYFLFFAESTGRTYTERTYQYNLKPLHEIRRFIIYRRQLGFTAVALNLAGNVVAFVPFGLFLPLQLFGKVGSFDVDDILLNTLGTACGYVSFLILFALRRKRGATHEKKGEKR